MENLIKFGVIGCIGLIAIGMIVLITCGVNEAQTNKSFRQGDITVEQYCEKITRGGTTESIPVACYEYFKVRQEGIRRECRYNPATKTNQCKNVPILVPN